MITIRISIINKYFPEGAGSFVALFQAGDMRRQLQPAAEAHAGCVANSQFMARRCVRVAGQTCFVLI
jgi:hypothetical protein